MKGDCHRSEVSPPVTVGLCHEDSQSCLQVCSAGAEPRGEEEKEEEEEE